ncbi:MAG: hypothetical protein QM724_10270 [Flavobacteriales bacterium]
MSPPSGPFSAPANDVWLRLDPVNDGRRYRFTLVPSSTTPALTDGAMALYEASSASGPFTLIECAVGGGYNAQMPSVEANCFTAGKKLYLRIWDQANRTSAARFTVCVQWDKSMTARNAGETPCLATSIDSTRIPSTTAALLLKYQTISYTYACEETASLLQTDSAYVGGDLWLKLVVPSSGTVNLYLAMGSTTSSRVGHIGLSAYLTSNCNDPAKFRQVGAFSSSSATSLQYPSSPTIDSPPSLALSCLPPGEILHLRIHSMPAAQSVAKRYGQFRLRWGYPAPSGALPSNNQPCEAIDLAFNTTCPVTGPNNDNFNACNTRGIPAPTCGSFNGASRDVWYKFTAPPSGTVWIEASPGTGVPADPAIALYTTGGNGCNGRFTLIACDDNRGTGKAARIIRTGLVPNQTYYIRAWDAKAADAMGTFSLCLSEPKPPAGTCFYLLDLWTANIQASSYADVVINGGAPIRYTPTYTTPTDLTESFLLAIPAGATVHFKYTWSIPSGASNTLHTWALYRLGDAAPLWNDFSGIGEAGPASHLYEYDLTNACQPLAKSMTDCLGATTICPTNGPNPYTGTLKLGNSGYRYDLTAANMGCLGTEDTGINWFIFRPVMNGTVAFWSSGTFTYYEYVNIFTYNKVTKDVDLDFAIWDAGPIVEMPPSPTGSLNINADHVCAPPGPPIRCSSARQAITTTAINTYDPSPPPLPPPTTTGLLPGLDGVTQEGTGGWGWLSPLNVTADHAYLIALVIAPGTKCDLCSSPAQVSYQLRWTLWNDNAGNPNNSLFGCETLVLPVELLFLQAEPRTHAVDLSWATTSERNSSHFVVERSRDARDFAPIGEVNAAGDSQQRIDYFFADAAPAKGINYYRLKQVDRDGSFHYSNVISAFFGDAPAQPLLIPNPATDEVDPPDGRAGLRHHCRADHRCPRTCGGQRLRVR